MRIQRHDLGFIEFILLMALMTSMVAMTIDSMLPALSMIGHDLGAKDNNQQYVVSAFLLAFGFAQMVFGPLSDALGRKPTIYIGIGIYVIGSVLCIFSIDFSDMIIGRVLQGIGVAGPRVTIVALVRDKYEGDAIARVMSLIMMVFIMTPILAPIIGQGILWIAEWRAIFVFLIVLALLIVIWFAVRQPETLKPENRRQFSLGHIGRSVIEILRIRVCMGYIIMSGLIFSAFVGYLSSAQQVFQETYGLGESFPLYFASLAAALGLASYSNSKLVLKFGMRRLCWKALLVGSCLSVVHAGVAYKADGIPSLTLFMAFLFPIFFCFGILFGNFVSLAMEPLGHIAGVGASAVGSISALISVPLGAIIGQQFDGTVFPLTLGFAFFSVLSLCLMRWVESNETGFLGRRRKRWQ